MKNLKTNCWPFTATVEQFWYQIIVLGATANNAVLAFHGDSRTILVPNYCAGGDGK